MVALWDKGSLELAASRVSELRAGEERVVAPAFGRSERLTIEAVGLDADLRYTLNVSVVPAGESAAIALPTIAFPGGVQGEHATTLALPADCVAVVRLRTRAGEGPVSSVTMAGARSVRVRPTEGCDLEIACDPAPGTTRIVGLYPPVGEALYAYAGERGCRFESLPTGAYTAALFRESGSTLELVAEKQAG